MKLFEYRTVVIILCLAFLVSCQSVGEGEPNIEDEMSSQNYDYDSDNNSRNAIDYEGLYSGTIPCADCEGSFTELIIKPNNQFSISTRYLGTGNDEVFSKSGNYRWIDGNRIELIGIESEPNKYFIGENQVWQLDMEGDRITGDLESKYILKKKI
jgi:uncharacterized lipoprotein NlpE involved in copper resistance